LSRAAGLGTKKRLVQKRLIKNGWSEKLLFGGWQLMLVCRAMPGIRKSTAA
jgi:hypothetical protein